ncbi:hypothetical protein RJT34_18467 [Clitoria ternatea]|uniref:Uncharacterized protein n=1 Tax=Clitoria ternatea TaxID=43366 RepID=A0AAN9JAV1_CLITE
MGVRLYGKDERHNATNLLSAMESREGTVLILDDVWEYIDLQDVGIPVGVNGFKLILTSRLKHVCRQMDCLPTNIIEIKPLGGETAWELFLLKLGHHGTPATLPHQTEMIARSIVHKCDGLPLGITMMARAMKGINDVHRWKEALEELENGKDMEEEVLRALKRSYGNLTGKHMQKCFLFCSIFGNASRIEVIMKLVENGLINGNRSLEKICNEGHTILDKLVDHSLLLENSDWRHTEMQGMVRKMACDMLLNERQSFMLKCKKGLRKMPDVREWTNDLEAVYLMSNEIEEIQEGTSPNCPRLSKLFLNSNKINTISECFFRQMNALTVLDLSYNRKLTRLPNSLTTLRSLIYLRLGMCSSLEYVPPLGELQALSILVISCCAIERVPEGLQSLINLKWLDLSFNEKMMLEAGVLTGLTNMQYLDLVGSHKAKIVAQDIQGMVMLECFRGAFQDCKNYNNYVQDVWSRGFGPKTSTLYWGDDAGWWPSFNVGDEECFVSFGDCDSEECCHLLPIHLQQLYLLRNGKWKCLCNAFSSPCPPSLTDIRIVGCRNLESLFCLFGGRTCTALLNLQSLTLERLESLSIICKKDVVDVVFYHLKKLDITECHGLKTLLTIEVLPQLKHLEEVTVNNCRSMVEIFAVSDDNGNGNGSTCSITIPRTEEVKRLLAFGITRRRRRRRSRIEQSRVAEGGQEMTGVNYASYIHQNDAEATDFLVGSTPEQAAANRSNNNIDGNMASAINDLNQLKSDLRCEENDIMRQLQRLECRGKKRKREVDIWLTRLQGFKKRVVDMTDLDKIYRFTRELLWHKAQKPLVLSNEFVGRKFEIDSMNMWKLLEDDQVFTIGIHGMGGVGKTFLATHMENEIKRKGTFKDVLWVTVSNDFSILRLQQDIAERMGVNLCGKDERRNATNLLSAMESREKTVLILDDVWEYIDLQDVGIPVGVNGFKLILTSRLKHVCRQMDCLPTNIIEIKPLSDRWELFLLKLGHHGTPATLPHRIQVIARSIVDRCDGLPLGIIMMARAMKGINDVRRWKQALEELENGKDMEEEVLRVLKRSYDNLTGKHMQKCFLFCSLFHDIDRTEMIMKLAENGMINGNRSLEKIFNEGHTILDKLVDHSLLMDYGGVIYMKGLVRKMACDILLNERQSYMVKCKKGLTKMPDVWEWTNDLEVVFLMHNEIEEIQEGTSPDCPRLSNLFLNLNNINNIPECFFRRMNALTVLDLSNNVELTRLPNSLTTLRSLISLRLRSCGSLEYVPPLGELQALSILVISGCAIEKVPEGLQSLINLKWLDLSNNEEMMLEAGVLTGLVNMQYLDLVGSPKAKIVAQDIQGMVMLECFAGQFHDCKNYNNFVVNTE